jgi:glycosyltransferase involved in cell wall biosynthesis
MIQEPLKKIITVVIPCHNEEDGIEHVLKHIPYGNLTRFGYKTEVIVVDNNSTDKTAEIAKSLGARVIEEKRKGKGLALKTGLKAINPLSSYIVIIDGDDTYKGTEMMRMIEPLEQDFCDIVVGSRLSGRIHDSAFSGHHRVANWAFTFLVRHFYKANITDTLSGYISLKKEVLENMLEHLTAHDFRIEMELITKAKRLGYYLTSVPISYGKRKGHSKLESYYDGIRILHTFLKNFWWKPPAK